jgi:hypothetical protein
MTMLRVEHLSYSAILTFLRNQVEFQKRYIAKVWDNAQSPSMVIGSAFHKALEMYYRDIPMQGAITEGLKVIENTSDYEIDYGKTGSREKMIKEYTTLVNKYFEECPKYEVIDVEKRFESTVHGVPMVGIVDLVNRTVNGGINIQDHKTVTTYSSPTDDPSDPEYIENYKYLLQGYIYLVLAENEYKEKIESVTFGEIKKSINKDGSPQSHDVVYDRDSILAFAPVAQKIITNVFSYVNDDNAKFFPNPSDIFNGQASMELVSNMEEGFDATKIKKKTNVADRFAPRNVTVDISDDTGTAEDMILKKFVEFGIGGIVGQTHVGASVIQYTFKPNRGISMNSIAKRSDDLAIALKSKYVRIEAPIAGTDLVGVEVPNEERRTINFEDKHLMPGTTMIPIGENVFGDVRYGDLAKMPHLLIAGQTGSGKSVMINVILKALTKQLSVNQLKLVLIDPKQVELAQYEEDSHLMRPIVTDALEAAVALDDLVKIMNKRYTVLRKAGVRSIDDYKGNMPRIVAVIDEFADLIMSDVKPSIETMDIKRFNENLLWLLEASSTGKLTQKVTKEAMKRTIAETAPPRCEESIVRIAQKARAVGIHLILATQRPSADVVTGLIKANVPTKIAFSVTTSINSKIILDQTGAEALTGYGDMLYQDPTSKNLERLQGFYC